MKLRISVLDIQIHTAAVCEGLVEKLFGEKMISSVLG